jgi:hypothetical protein
MTVNERLVALGLEAQVSSARRNRDREALKRLLRRVLVPEADIDAALEQLT